MRSALSWLCAAESRATGLGANHRTYRLYQSYPSSNLQILSLIHISEPGIKAFKGHLIKWLNAAKWSREKSVLRLMIPEATTCCWIWRLDDG